MFCTKCGKNCEDGSKFCDECGSPFEKESLLSTNSFNEIKELLKNLFSKSPILAIKQAAASKSYTWVWLLFFNVIIFGFTLCNNITQIINQFMGASAGSVRSAVGSLTGNPFAGGAINTFNIPVLYRLFFPLMLIGLVAIAIEFFSIFTALKIRKVRVNNWNGIASVSGVASVPITVALVINFLLGMIFPSIVPFVFAASILISLMLTYEGIKSTVVFEVEPTIEFGLIILIMCLIFFILFSVLLSQAGGIIASSFF